MDIRVNDLTALIDEQDERTQRVILDRLIYSLESRADAHFKIEHQHAWEALRVNSDEVKSVPPLAIFAAKYGKAKLVADLDRLNDFATKSCGVQLQMSQRLIVLKLIVACHADHLRSMTIDRKRMVIRPLSLLRNLASIPMAVDRAFPGYSEARILDRAALVKTRIAA